MKRGRWKPEANSSMVNPLGSFNSAPSGRLTIFGGALVDGVAKGGGSLSAGCARAIALPQTVSARTNLIMGLDLFYKPARNFWSAPARRSHVVPDACHPALLFIFLED